MIMKQKLIIIIVLVLIFLSGCKDSVKVNICSTNYSYIVDTYTENDEKFDNCYIEELGDGACYVCEDVKI